MGFDVNKIKVKFIIKYPQFKDLIGQLEIVMDPKESTAATDGEKLYFNPEYMSKLSEQQQLFVFAHEVLHVALDHIDRSEGKDRYLWNIASDAIINAYLTDDGLEQPENTVDIANALNYYTEQLYEKLKKQDEEDKKKEQDQSDIKQGDKKGNGREVETPSPNSDSNKENDDQKEGDQKSPSDDNGNEQKDDDDKEQDGKQSPDNDTKSDDDKGQDGKQQDEKDSPSEKPKSNDSQNDMVGHDSHSRWEDAAKKHREEREKNGEKEKPKVDEKAEMQKNKDLRKRLGDDYYQQAQDSQNQINNPSDSSIRDGNSNFDDVNATQIDWRRILKESVRVDYDWDMTTLEVENGVVMPSFLQQPKAKTEIVIDSSGSISDDLIQNFLKECINILNTSELEVGFFDDSFHGFEYIRNEEDIVNIERKGGGGTDFNAAVSAFTNRADNKIIFTDGYASNPKESSDAIWIVVGYYKNEINPPGGKVIYICGEDYERLNRPCKSKSR